MENDSSARDVFMYLLVLIVLAMSAINLGTLLFQYVNIYVPDTAIQQCFSTSCTDAIRWSLASIIVVFSVLIWARRFLQKDIGLHPEKAQSRIRRWMIYLTLFVSGGTLIGDAIALLNSWLQGDLTVQFILKALVVLYIGVTIFYYFLKAMHPEVKSLANIVVYAAILVVIASVVVGFVTSGSPFRARSERLDGQRVMDLQTIQNQIVSVYWQSKGQLPQTLGDLQDSINGFVVPIDPKTKLPYEYIRKSGLSFVLCALFVTQSNPDATSSALQEKYPTPAYYPGGMNVSWGHDIGRVCFDRTIDPTLYPVYSPQPLR